MRKTEMLIALLAGAVSVQASVIYVEQFDGTTGYAATSTGGGTWLGFKSIGSSLIAPTIEGYGTASSGESVLAGQQDAGDSQIRSEFVVGLDASTATNISLRIRADLNKDLTYNDTIASGAVSVFYGTASYVIPGGANQSGVNINLNGLAGVTETIESEANGWTVFNYSFAAGTLGQINSWRIDPVDSTSYTGGGYSFEIDYLQVEAIPEPATLGMVAAFGGAVLFIRRRLML